MMVVDYIFKTDYILTTEKFANLKSSVLFLFFLSFLICSIYFDVSFSFPLLLCVFIFRSFCCNFKIRDLWLTFDHISTNVGLVYTEDLNPLKTECFWRWRGILFFEGSQAMPTRPSEKSRMKVKTLGWQVVEA
jgi:hypothetical protein